MVRIQEEAQSEPLPRVPRAGLEPARPFGQQILSLQCLPIPPPGQLVRRRPDSNRRMTVLQTGPLSHLGTTPYF